DVNEGAAGALGAMAPGALAREHARAASGVADEGPFVEHDARTLAPRVERSDERLDVFVAERAAMASRPGRHRRAGPAVGDRVPQELVAHRREEILVPERGGLIGRVPP